MSDWVKECVNEILREQERIWKQREWTMFKAKKIEAWQERGWLALTTRVRGDIEHWNQAFGSYPERRFSIEISGSKMIIRCRRGTIEVRNEWHAVTYKGDKNKEWVDYDCDSAGNITMRSKGESVWIDKVSEMILKPLIEQFMDDRRPEVAQ